MNDFEPTSIDEVLNTIRQRWGAGAITHGSQLHSLTYVSTGFAQLDTLLSGGVTCGRITELVGQPTSGKNTIALSTLSTYQHSGGIAVYFDIPLLADADYIATLGITASNLLIVRASLEIALAILQDIVISRVPCGVLFDLSQRLSHTEERKAESGLRQISSALTGSQTFILLLLSHIRPYTQNRSAVRILLSHLSWIVRENDVIGCHVMAQLTRQKGNIGEKKTSLELFFPDMYFGGET